MGRHFSIASLPPEQQAQVDECIRSNRYMVLDRIMASIQEHGINGISRNALHRYLCRLKEQDALQAQPNEGTIITIVERGTGEVRVIKTSASAASIAAMVAKLQPVPVVS